MSASIGIREMYQSANRSLDYGIAGYQVEKKYIDPIKQL